MSLTRDSLQELHEERSREVRLTAGTRRPPLGHWLTDAGVVPGRWPQALGVAWIVVFAGAALLEPAPADPEAADPLWASLVFLSFFAVLGAMAAGLTRRQRAGLVASVGAAGLGLLASAMCPVSGHHASVGAWWYLQMAGFTGLVVASLAGLRRSRVRA